MASTTTVIRITHNETVNQMKTVLGADAGTKHVQAQRLSNYFNALLAGARNANIDVQVGGGVAAQASGTITFTGLPTANDTCSINGVTFTAKASGATGNQFNIGANATATAAALAAAVNASVTAGIVNVLTASAASGVVTLTCIDKGYVGNSVPLSTALTNTTASGANFTGGVNRTANTYSYGL